MPRFSLLIQHTRFDCIYLTFVGNSCSVFHFIHISILKDIQSIYDMRQEF